MTSFRMNHNIAGTSSGKRSFFKCFIIILLTPGSQPDGHNKYNPELVVGSDEGQTCKDKLVNRPSRLQNVRWGIGVGASQLGQTGMTLLGVNAFTQDWG